MNRIRVRVASGVCVVLLATGLAAAQSIVESGRERRIAVFGSSVPNGTGDELRMEGYTGRLRELLATRGWEVLNQSRGGDTTSRLAERFQPVGEPAPNTRYLLPVDPGYAIIALSLGNEGIKTTSNADAGRIFEQYAAGLKAMIERCREHDIVPIVTLAYSRADFGPREHEAVRRMNLLINSWDVPSVNLLAPVDDGFGRWAVGFEYDTNHPNAAGHQEMFHAFVPTLFDALAAGKPIPTWSTAAGFARAAGGDAFVFEPQETMRSFAVSVRVRQADGVLGAVSGQTVHAHQEWKQLTQRDGAVVDYKSHTLTPSGSRFKATLAFEDDRLVYTAASGMSIASAPPSSPTGWRHVVLSHSVVRGETCLYLDGRLVASVKEMLQPDRFLLGGSAAPSGADYRDWLIYRSALNDDEVAALNTGQLLQASLEIYAPLADARLTNGRAVENRAQSLAVATVASDRVMHVEE